jgi:hypothetical protein
VAVPLQQSARYTKYLMLHTVCLAHSSLLFTFQYWNFMNTLTVTSRTAASKDFTVINRSLKLWRRTGVTVWEMNCDCSSAEHRLQPLKPLTIAVSKRAIAQNLAFAFRDHLHWKCPAAFLVTKIRRLRHELFVLKIACGALNLAPGPCSGRFFL